MDPFGNPVRVQATVGPQINTQELSIATGEQQVTQNDGNITSLEALRSNPMIQQLVEERMAILEMKMKAELQQGIHRQRKSGRYNISDTPHTTPHLRWPNEACIMGTARKRFTFDELTLGQFVIGFVTNMLDTHHVETHWNMLNELVETVKVAENISCSHCQGCICSIYVEG